MTQTKYTELVAILLAVFLLEALIGIVILVIVVTRRQAQAVLDFLFSQPF